MSTQKYSPRFGECLLKDLHDGCDLPSNTFFFEIFEKKTVKRDRYRVEKKHLKKTLHLPK